MPNNSVTDTCGICRLPYRHDGNPHTLSLDRQSWHVCNGCRKSFLQWMAGMQEQGLESLEKMKDRF